MKWPWDDMCAIGGSERIEWLDHLACQAQGQE